MLNYKLTKMRMVNLRNPFFNLKLIRNIMYQMKLLKDFLIPPNRVIEKFHFSEYVIRLQIQRQIQAKRKKLALENLHENKIPVNQTTDWFF